MASLLTLEGEKPGDATLHHACCQLNTFLPAFAGNIDISGYRYPEIKAGIVSLVMIITVDLSGRCYGYSEMSELSQKGAVA